MLLGLVEEEALAPVLGMREVVGQAETATAPVCLAVTRLTESERWKAALVVLGHAPWCLQTTGRLSQEGDPSCGSCLLLAGATERLERVTDGPCRVSMVELVAAGVPLEALHNRRLHQVPPQTLLPQRQGKVVLRPCLTRSG